MNEAGPIPLGRVLTGTILFFISFHFCFSLGWQAGAGVIMGLPVLLALFLPRKEAPFFLLGYVGICFCVADRTIYVGDFYRIYPQEILIFVLMVHLFFTVGVPQGKSLIPMAGKAMGILTLVGLITAIVNEIPLSLSLFYMKGFFLFLPIFFCVRCVLTSEWILKYVCLCFVVGAAVGAVMNLADFHGLGIAKVVFLETEKEIVAGQQMAEAHSYANPFFRTRGIHTFGSFTAPCIYLIFFLAMYLHRATEQRGLRLFIRFAQVIFMIYLFHAGFRSVWIAFAISLFLYGLFQGARGIIGFGLLALILTVAVPQVAIDRFGRLSGEEQDSGVAKRVERLDSALRGVGEKPILGGGWGSAGLVHNDIVQIAGESGLATAILFLLFYGGVLSRLYQKYRRAKRYGHLLESHCVSVFLSALVGYLMVWATGTQLYTQEVIIVFWIFLALAAKITDLPIGESAKARAQVPWLKR